MTDSINYGEMTKDIQNPASLKRGSRASGLSAFSLGVGQIVTVNEAEHFVTIRVSIGEDQEYQKNPVPITFPYAGKRAFCGMMPQRGDYCVLGWMPQNTGMENDSKIPVILGWIPQGVWLGHDWMISQEFSPEEFAQTEKNKNFVKGAYFRTRHKLKPLKEGNFLCSSAQGSDLQLDEGVLLANRRGNEIRLRDQDQAFIIRSLQEYHALAGARIYAGTIHREGFFLPTQMFSDGKNWAQKNQKINDSLVHENQLEKNIFPEDFLTPSKVLQRSPNGSTTTRRFGPNISESLDPFVFLQKGLFIDERGFLAESSAVPDAIYGGKPLFRVSAPRDEETTNSITSRIDPALTEYRIEVSHTSDGTLPVTEQTDLFDVDRLPKALPNTKDEEAKNPNTPFIEMAYGSVVGNNPFSATERSLYGQPLRVSIFEEDGTPNPQVLSALERPIAEHSASLFRLFPLVDQYSPSFSSFLKNGEFRFFLSGQKSLEGFCQGSGKITFGSDFSFTTNENLSFSCLGFSLDAQNNGIEIRSGNALLMEIKDDVSLSAGQNFQIRGAEVNMAGNAVLLQALSNIQIASGDLFSVQSRSLQIDVVGKVTENFTGPKDNDAVANGATRETTFSNSISSEYVADKYKITFGSRAEEFLNGNHSTTMTIGNLTYETNNGTFKARSGNNEITINNTSGINATAQAGNIQASATVGNMTLTALTEGTFRVTGGNARVSGFVQTVLGAGAFVGNAGIVNSLDIDPLTGLTLGDLGLGSAFHRLTAAL